MRCPYCSNEETKVVDKRDVEGITRRRRECMECKKRFTTHEKAQINLIVIKKDSRKEEFSREKLRLGIVKACEKRPITQEQIEEVVDDIELKLMKMGEVESKKIGELVMKVKEPLESEYKFLSESQILFTYLHLAGVTRTLTEELLKKKVTGIAYETVEDSYHRLPLLAPMSAVAGNMAVQIGAYYLAKFNNGKGLLLGEVLGHFYGKVVIVGDGVVGRHAAKTAYGMGANVYLFGRHQERMDLLKDAIGRNSHILLSTPENISQHIKMLI